MDPITNTSHTARYALGAAALVALLLLGSCGRDRTGTDAATDKSHGTTTSAPTTTPATTPGTTTPGTTTPDTGSSATTSRS